MGKISVSSYNTGAAAVEGEDISNKYWQAVSAGQKKEYKIAKELLKSIIAGKFDKKYSPLALLDFYSFTAKEEQTKDSKSITPNTEYNDLLKGLYDRPLNDSLRPFAVRLLSREAALSKNNADVVKYNTELINNYPNSSNELAALYDLVIYYNIIENSHEKANKYLTMMKCLHTRKKTLHYLHK